mgnify:CR=1 FL=1
MTINKFMLKDGRLFLDGNELNWVEKFSLSADEGDARLTLDMRVDLLSSEEEKQEDRKEISPWISAETPPDKYKDEDGEPIPFLVRAEYERYPTLAFYTGKLWEDEYWSTNIVPLSVTHYMPVPELPKRG